MLNAPVHVQLVQTQTAMMVKSLIHKLVNVDAQRLNLAELRKNGMPINVNANVNQHQLVTHLKLLIKIHANVHVQAVEVVETVTNRKLTMR